MSVQVYWTRTIQTGIFGKQGYLIQVISTIKKGVIEAIHFAVLQVENLQVVTAITFQCTHYLSKSNKKAEHEFRFYKFG
jgi:hypothetical protein